MGGNQGVVLQNEEFMNMLNDSKILESDKKKEEKKNGGGTRRIKTISEEDSVIYDIHTD